ncbi:hypothetical protein ACJIZ3_007611 [Penstemon smallii]|uniref:TF-B3 domain-containing protein n=1 Tax=Penstemon smallii TaxID=265156 RepID=A0ABD3T849_9LAMI
MSLQRNDCPDLSYSATINYLGGPIFFGENFDDWSIETKTFLKSKNLWKIVEEGYEAPNSRMPLVEEDQKQLKRDSLALLLIREGLSDELLPSIKNTKTAKEAWDFLHQVFQGTSKNDASESALPEKIDNVLENDVDDEPEYDVEDEPEFAFLSKEPFHDVILMKSHVMPSCCLHFPFRIYHRLPSKDLPAIISCNGKTWNVIYRGDAKIRGFKASSWKKFVEDNNLKTDDALVFEHTATDDTKVEFQVHILRSDIHPKLKELIAKRRARSLIQNIH